MTKILAFSGRKQSGKTTGAEYVEYLINSQGLNISHRIYSFADALKDLCINILGLTYEQCYGSDEDKNTMTKLEWQGEKLTARRAMEVVGTDIFRKLYNPVWVETTINKIKKDNLDLAIICDCRFPNEADIILEDNGYIIRLDLDPFNSQSNSESALDKHKYPWSKFSCIIANSGMTIQQKNEAILRFLSEKGILSL